MPRPSLSLYGGILDLMDLRRLAAPGLLALALGVVGAHPLASVARAATPPGSDIPGIALPGPVVSGPLGGPIYDVVYRIDVPAGHVLLVGLTGSAGTDFDLYLYAPTATTVHSLDWVLAKSTGPTSTEQIFWPSRIELPVYLDLNGASEVQGTYNLTVQVVPDPTPPVVGSSLVGGGVRTNQTTVTLQVNGYDDLSGVTEMSFSSDGLAWLPWEPFANTRAWDLLPGDGQKTVWVRVVNGVGVTSDPVALTVTLDTTPPAIVDRSPPADSTINVLRPTLTVTFNEPLDPSSWQSNGLVMQASTGAIVGGSFAYLPATNTGTFTPTAPLTLGSLYIVTVGAVRDLAGNVAGPIGSWTLKPLLATSLSLAASPGVVVYGSTTTISGRAPVPSSGGATLQQRAASSAEFTAVPGVPTVSGTFSFNLTPRSNSVYRLSYAGSGVAAASVSAEVQVLVRRGVRLLGSAPSTVRTATAGKVVPITAQLAPAGPAVVTFRAYRYDTSRARYILVGSFGRLADATGRATVRWTPSAGRWYWQVIVPPSATFANNTSAAYRWVVSR